MAKVKKPSYASYQSKGNFSKNALLKLQRHLKKHPEDKQAISALKTVPVSPTRKKPTNKGGWVQESIRSFMSHLPHLTPLQGKIYHNQVAPTKSNLFSYASIYKFCKNNPYMKTLVGVKGVDPITKLEVINFEWKHTSKLSNFIASPA